MQEKSNFSRRNFLTAAGAAAVAATRIVAATIDEKERLPIIPKRVEKLYKIPGIKEPNDLQFTSDGNLLILDQVDPNKVFTVNPNDGSIINQIQTESIHGSGITIGNGALWIGSTKTLKTLKVDPKTGKTLKSFDTPGAGLYGKLTTPSGAHGLKWVDGKYWMAVPASGKIYLMEPESGQIVRSILAPTVRTHGLAWDNGLLWCVGSTEREIYKMDPNDGKLLAKIKLTKEDPEPHGLDMYQGALWYCDAVSSWVCKLV
jgi:outer membrane protein assembly factor BamB